MQGPTYDLLGLLTAPSQRTQNILIAARDGCLLSAVPTFFAARLSALTRSERHLGRQLYGGYFDLETHAQLLKDAVVRNGLADQQAGR